jgi:hypothetical protein
MLSRELAYWQSVVDGLAKPKISILPHHPDHREPPGRRLEVISAWEGIPNILSDIIDRFYFDSVVGVDLFCGDKHTVNKQDIYEETLSRLSAYSNIELVRSDYRDFIQGESGLFDLIHVDIVHTFADTFACGLWSAKHSKCTIFHDTESFPQVKQAVVEIARASGKKFYNFQESNGLGILI